MGEEKGRKRKRRKGNEEAGKRREEVVRGIEEKEGSGGE